MRKPVFSSYIDRTRSIVYSERLRIQVCRYDLACLHNLFVTAMCTCVPYIWRVCTHHTLAPVSMRALPESAHVRALAWCALIEKVECARVYLLKRVKYERRKQKTHGCTNSRSRARFVRQECWWPPCDARSARACMQRNKCNNVADADDDDDGFRKHI